MIGSWKKQFTLSKFYLVHKDPSVFIASQWQKNKTEPNLKYLTYRTIIMLMFFVTWVISIVNEAGAGKWPIFLTNWGYTLCTLQATLAFIMLSTAVLLFDSKSKIKDSVLSLYPVYWLLNVVATPTAFAITVVYWTVIFDAEKMTFDAMNYFVHGNNSILMFIDLFIVAHPVMLLHVVYPIILGTAYTIFSLIYYSAGGTSKDGARYIYKIVDWSKPGPTLGTCLGVIAFLVILHILIVLISLARRTAEEKCCSKKLDITMTETKRQAVYVNEAMSADIV